MGNAAAGKVMGSNRYVVVANGSRCTGDNACSRIQRQTGRQTFGRETLRTLLSNYGINVFRTSGRRHDLPHIDLSICILQIDSLFRASGKGYPEVETLPTTSFCGHIEKVVQEW